VQTTFPAGRKEVGRSCRPFNACSFEGGSIGSSGDVIVGHFAINYHNEAKSLGIDLAELYAAQLADAELNPPEWNIQGRQSNVYKSGFFLPHLRLPLCTRAERCRAFVVLMAMCLTAHLTLTA
jgi:hypothetical protein